MNSLYPHELLWYVDAVSQIYVGIAYVRFKKVPILGCFAYAYRYLKF
jgi:hypothetical protein